MFKPCIMRAIKEIEYPGGLSMAAALILVVDDNEMNRDMLSRRLKRQEYDVVMAEDGEKALELLQVHNFDLVLLDIMMPKLSGYEVLEQIKKNPATQHLPVIMISAVDDLDSVVKCVEMGAEDYLFKPFNPVLLKARVSASLDKAHWRQGGTLGAREVASHVQAAQDSLEKIHASLSADDQQHLALALEHLARLAVLAQSPQ
jgi:DNA-binding response OmpR family regulator